MSRSFKWSVDRLYISMLAEFVLSVLSLDLLMSNVTCKSSITTPSFAPPIWRIYFLFTCCISSSPRTCSAVCSTYESYLDTSCKALCLQQFLVGSLRRSPSSLVLHNYQTRDSLEPEPPQVRLAP